MMDVQTNKLEKQEKEPSLKNPMRTLSEAESLVMIKNLERDDLGCHALFFENKNFFVLYVQKRETPRPRTLRVCWLGNSPHPDFPYSGLFHVLAMKQKYYAFAVRSSKVVTDRTGVSRNRDVLVYGTQLFATAEDCDNAYHTWRCSHPLKMSTIVEFERKPRIDALTHELLGFYPDKEQVQ